MRWLLDTNVISEMRRPRPSPSVISWIENLTLADICTSAVNIAELRYGAGVVADGLLQLEISSWIENSVRPWLTGRIYGVDENTLMRWRYLSRRLASKREPTPPVDLLIAAVAQENSLSIATRDTNPFIGTGVPVLNPWTGERFNGA